jgi:thioredoxin reductase (NADPH)
MALLDVNTINQLKEVFKRLDKEIKIVNFISENNEKSKELESFLREFSVVSDKIVIENIDYDNSKDKVEEFNIDKIPAMAFVNNKGEQTGGKFHGIPGGHEINSFVITLLNTGEVGKEFDLATKEKVEAIDKEINLKVFVTLACHHCPDVVVTTQMMALKNKNINAEMIDIALFPELAEKHSVKSVPTVIYNNSEITIGAKNANEILSKIENL